MGPLERPATGAWIKAIFDVPISPDSRGARG